MAGHHRTAAKPGARFGMLVISKQLRKNEHSQVLWEVKCDCGRTAYAWGYNLVKGKTNCGCIRAQGDEDEVKIFCGTCNVLIGRPHRLGHSMLTYKQLSAAQKEIVAIHLGARLARVVDLDPVRIVSAFVSALEDANQHDFARIVRKQWATLLKH